MKILAVDDDPLILELLESCLASSDYEDLIKVESAEEALDLIEALDGANCSEGDGAFDVFLLDIQMPGLNGIELCKRIRILAAYENTPIIMISSLSDRKHINDAFSAGATDYIMKPFDNLEVASRIRLANMIVDDRKKSLESYFTGLVGESAKNSMFDAYFRQPLVFDNIPRLVDYRVLENFLIKISRKDLYRSAAIAFRYSGADKVFSSQGPERFSESLTLISTEISKYFSEADNLLSYLGSGYFVMIARRSTLAVATNASEKINNDIKSAKFDFGNDAVTILVGDPVDCYTASKDGIQAIISRAIGAIPGNDQFDGISKMSLKKEMRLRAKKFDLWRQR